MNCIRQSLEKFITRLKVQIKKGNIINKVAYNVTSSSITSAMSVIMRILTSTAQAKYVNEAMQLFKQFYLAVEFGNTTESTALKTTLHHKNISTWKGAAVGAGF